MQLLEDVARAQGIDPRAPGHYPPDEFPDPGTVLELVEQAGFVVAAGGVVAVAQRRAFDRDGLARFLRTQAALPFVRGLPEDARAAFLGEAERRLDEIRRNDGTFDLTFVRLDVPARRPHERCFGVGRRLVENRPDRQQGAEQRHGHPYAALPFPMPAAIRPLPSPCELGEGTRNLALQVGENGHRES